MDCLGIYKILEENIHDDTGEEVEGKEYKKELMKLSHTFIENDIDNLKLACEYWERRHKADILEKIFAMYYKSEKNEKLKNSFNDVMKALELLFNPMKLIRGMNSLLRAFYHKGEGKETLDFCFSEMLDILDYFIEAKNDALEQETYYLLENQLFEPCKGISPKIDDVKEKSEYCFSLMFMGKKDQKCDLITVLHENEADFELFKIMFEGSSIVLRRNEGGLVKVLLDDCLMKNCIISYSWDEKKRIKICVNWEVRHEEYLPKSFSFDVGFKKIEILKNFNGRFLQLIGFDSSNDAIMKLLYQQIPQGIQGKQDKMKILKIAQENKLKFKVFSRILKVDTSFIGGNSGMVGWASMGKTKEERNLALSPGLTSLVPYFTYLKFSKRNELYENLRKLLVISGVVISQIDVDRIEGDNLKFPGALKLIILDLTKRNVGFKVDSGISNLFFLIYQNCVNLEFKDNWLKNILCEWKFYSWMNESTFKNIELQFSELFCQHSVIDHYNLIESILVFLDAKRLRTPAISSIKYKKLNMNTLNPLKIYKQFLKTDKNLDAKILKKVLLAFSDLLKFKNSPKVEISFLTIFKKIVAKIQNHGWKSSKSLNSHNTGQKLSCMAVEKISSSLVEKFKNGKLETKNVVMEILTMILTSEIKQNIENSEESKKNFNKICSEISSEINFFFKKNVFDRGFIRDESSNFTHSEIKKNSSIKSQLSEILTPSKHASTPKGLLLSGKKFKMNKFGDIRKKKLNLDMATINETPKEGTRNKIIFKNPPRSMKNVERKNFDFPSTRAKMNTSFNFNKGSFASNCDGNGKKSARGAKSKIIFDPKIFEKKPKKKVKCFRSKRKEFLKKKKLTLDTEEINKLFNFGGEKGRKIANQDDDEILKNKINELALDIVNKMEEQHGSDNRMSLEEPRDEISSFRVKIPKKVFKPKKEFGTKVSLKGFNFMKERTSTNPSDKNEHENGFKLGGMKSAPMSKKGPGKKIKFEDLNLKISNLKIISERSTVKTINSKRSKCSNKNINNINPEKEFLRNLKPSSYLHPQKIFQMKYKTPRSNSTNDNFLSQKTVKNYIDLLTIKTFKLANGEDPGDFNFKLKRFSTLKINIPENNGKKRMERKYSSTKNKGSKGIFVFNFMPMTTQPVKRKIEFMNYAKKKEKKTEKIDVEMLNCNLLSSLHTVIKISPNHYKSKLCNLGTKIMKKHRYDFSIWKNLSRLFYEIMWEYYSPELNKISLEDLPLGLSSKHRSVFSRGDLSEFILVYVIKQIKFGNIQESKKIIQLLFTMNVLKSKMFSSSIGINPSMMTVLDKLEQSFKLDEFSFEPFVWKKIFHYFFMRFLERLKLVKHNRLQVMSDELFVINRYNLDNLGQLMNNFEEIQILDKMINYNIRGIQETHEESRDTLNEYEILFKATKEETNGNIDFFVKEIFESKVSNGIIGNMQGLLDSPNFKNNGVEEIFSYQDDSISKVARRINLIEYIILYCLTCLNSTITPPSLGKSAEEVKEGVGNQLKMLLKYLKMLIFYYEFSGQRNSKELSSAFRSPTANKSCLFCCLLVSYSSLVFFYKKMRNSKFTLANQIKDTLKDLTEFIGNCLYLQRLKNPSFFEKSPEISKTKRRIGGFFGSNNMNKKASLLKEFSDSYFKITVYHQSPQKPRKSAKKIVKRKPKKFNLQIKTEIQKEKQIELFSTSKLDNTNSQKKLKILDNEVEGLLSKTWLSDPKSKRIMDKMKFNLVEFSREFSKFKIESLKRIKEDIMTLFEPKKSSMELIQSKRNKLKIILNRIIDNKSPTPMALNQMVTRILLNRLEWMDFGVGAEQKRNYVFEELPFISSDYSFPLTVRRFHEGDTIKKLTTWKLGKIFFYLKIKEVTNVLDKDFFFINKDKEKMFLYKKCRIIKTGLATTAVAIISTHRLIFLIFEIPKSEDCIVYSLKDIANLKRFMLEGDYRGLEVTLTSKRNFLIEFEGEKDQHDFSKKLVRLRKLGTSNLVYKNTLNPKSLFRVSSYKSLWIEGKMSNFEYLNILNSFCSRSNHDRNYHPLMPQVIKQSKDKIGGRDLSKKSKGERQEKELEAAKKDEYPDGINYLVRKYPYSYVSIGNFPLVDVKNLHLEPKSPDFLYSEFFFEPSFLLGTKDMDRVILPDWAKDPFKYIYLQRKVLEGAEISKSLHCWIDQFFGCKSRQRIPSSSKNRIDSKDLKGSPSSGTIQTRGNYSKLDLFDEEHPPKNFENFAQKFGIKGFKLKMYEPNEAKYAEEDGTGQSETFDIKSSKNDLNENSRILKMITTDSNLLLSLSKAKIEIMKFSNLQKNPKLGILSEIELSDLDNRPLFDLDNFLINPKKHIDVLWRNKTLIFLDLESQFQEEEMKRIKLYHFGDNLKARIQGNLCFKVDSEILIFTIFSSEKLIAIGLNNGIVSVCKVNYDYKSQKGSNIQDYPCEIRFIKSLGQPCLDYKIESITVNESINTIIIGKSNGTIFAINSVTGDLISSVQSPDSNTLSNACLLTSPFTFFLAFSHDTNEFSTINIINSRIDSLKLEEDILDFKILDTKSHSKKLVLLSSKGEIQIYSLPYFEEIQFCSNSKNPSPGILEISRDCSSIFIASRDKIILCLP